MGIAPVINLRRCDSFYRDRNCLLITDDNICTVQLSGKNCLTNEDGGSALIVDEKLVGVLVLAGSLENNNSPDVFERVNGNTYYTWMMQHIVPHVHDVNGQHPYSQN